MGAKYLIRLDDACDTSDLDKWQAIEAILDEFEISPMVAVIPDNQDESLYYSDSNPRFWSMVKAWEKKGWAIAMHGYQHTYHYVDKRKLLFPFYDRSEFGGLSFAEQRYKIRESVKIFKNNDIEPSLWIAPSHSFDAVTLSVLEQEASIRVVSDGIGFQPYRYKGFQFVPQQLWNIERKRAGVWTVCLHPDTMTEEAILEFRAGLAQDFMRGNVISLNEVTHANSDKDLKSRLFSGYFWFRYRLVSLVKAYVN